MYIDVVPASSRPLHTLQQCQSMLSLTDTACWAADESGNERFPVVHLLLFIWGFIHLSISCRFGATCYLRSVNSDSSARARGGPRAWRHPNQLWPLFYLLGRADSWCCFLQLSLERSNEKPNDHENNSLIIKIVVNKIWTCVSMATEETLSQWYADVSQKPFEQEFKFPPVNQHVWKHTRYALTFISALLCLPADAKAPADSRV